MSPWEAASTVLGVPRLHYILATGDVTSKSGAGQYALASFSPRWEFATMVIEDARHRIG